VRLFDNWWDFVPASVFVALAATFGTSQPMFRALGHFWD
jgi:hypothetical protein